MESMISYKLNHQIGDILINVQFKNYSGITAINMVCYIMSKKKKDLNVTFRILNENYLHIWNICNN